LIEFKLINPMYLTYWLAYNVLIVTIVRIELKVVSFPASVPLLAGLRVLMRELMAFILMFILI